MVSADLNELKNCPCFSGRAFADCCNRYLGGTSFAPTAEALMRSRYAAFATHNIDYLEATLQPEKRKEFDRQSAYSWAHSCEWTGLEILSVKDASATTGIVEFIAHYRQNAQDFQHHETSAFIRNEGAWYYVDGVQKAVRVSKAGRNEPCPCGSGRKYKKCCGK